MKAFITGTIVFPVGLHDNREGKDEDRQREAELLMELSHFTGQPMGKVIKNRQYTFRGVEEWMPQTGWATFTYHTRELTTPCASTQNKVRLHVLNIDMLLRVPEDDRKCCICMAGGLVSFWVDHLTNKAAVKVNHCHFQVCPLQDGQMKEFTLDMPGLALFPVVDQETMHWEAIMAGPESTVDCSLGDEGKCTVVKS